MRRSIALFAALFFSLGLTASMIHAEGPSDRDQLISMTLTVLPQEWEITRAMIEINECAWVQEGREYSDAELQQRDDGILCTGYAGQAHSNPRMIELNARLLGDYAVGWYTTILHEAVHIAHFNACDYRADRNAAGLNQMLLGHLFMRYQVLVGETFPYDLCDDHQGWWNQWGEVVAQWESLPWLQRPSWAYGLSGFYEYVAGSVADWLHFPNFLRITDPATYAAIEWYGLAAKQ